MKCFVGRAGSDMFKCGETHSHAEQSRAVVVLNPETVFGQISLQFFGEIFLHFLVDSSYVPWQYCIQLWQAAKLNLEGKIVLGKLTYQLII